MDTLGTLVRCGFLVQNLQSSIQAYGAHRIVSGFPTAVRIPPAHLKLLNGLERLGAVGQGLFQVLAIGHAQVLEPREQGRGSGCCPALYPIPDALPWSRRGR